MSEFKGHRDQFAKKLIVAKVEWMEFYEGEPIRDPVFAFPKIFGIGGEQKNFFEQNDGVVLGYAPHKRNISIENFDPSAKGKDKYSPVLVVWAAKPDPKSGYVMVGWYENATVYRSFEDHHCQFEANIEDATLLNIGDRTLSVPVGKGLMGDQAKIWYASENNQATKTFRKGLIDQIQSFKNRKDKKPKRSSKSRSTVDVERRKEVEKIAVHTTEEYYKTMGYEVRSVESENVGYDLLAISKSRSTSLCIEVKGRTVYQAKNVNVELTPNEYDYFETKRKEYRLAVVSVMNGREPLLQVCKYSENKRRWVVEGSPNTKVDVEPVLGGRISLSRDLF